MLQTGKKHIVDFQWTSKHILSIFLSFILCLPKRQWHRPLLGFLMDSTLPETCLKELRRLHERRQRIRADRTDNEPKEAFPDKSIYSQPRYFHSPILAETEILRQVDKWNKNSN